MDTAFRKKLVNGFVHDPAAAMLGGVAGNAGLFSDAGNLAVIMQMLLNKGTYGGMQFLKPATIALFTSRFNENSTNRRGLVFDKPDAIAGKNGPTAISASPATFGHIPDLRVLLPGPTPNTIWSLFFFLTGYTLLPRIKNWLTGNYRTDMMEACL
jgi:CubicO group peptidase (beta-lactamase class C family)